MTIYLDMCCFNRPFDDQGQPRVQLETEAKLLIQQQVRDGIVQLAWSYMLEYENSANPDKDVNHTIASWEKMATILIEPRSGIPERAKQYQILGIGAKDALHIACAVEAKDNYFLTVDKGILKRRDKITDVTILSPL